MEIILGKILFEENLCPVIDWSSGKGLEVRLKILLHRILFEEKNLCPDIDIGPQERDWRSRLKYF